MIRLVLWPRKGKLSLLARVLMWRERPARRPVAVTFVRVWDVPEGGGPARITSVDEVAVIDNGQPTASTEEGKMLCKIKMKLTVRDCGSLYTMQPLPGGCHRGETVPQEDIGAFERSWSKNRLRREPTSKGSAF